MHVRVRLGKIDGEFIMPKAVITHASHFYQGSHICLGVNDWEVNYA